MAVEPTTRPSLLIRIRDMQDAEAWQQFVRLYAPLVYGFARKRGLQDADAADLTQEVLRTVTVTAERLDYDPERGSFRGWLFTVVRNRVLNFLAGQRRHWQGSGDTGLHTLLTEQAAPEQEEAALWNQEYEQRLFVQAVTQVRDLFQDSSWQAFWQTAMQSKKPKAVAEALGMSIAAVYKAKSRVMAQLKRQVQQLRGN